MQRLTPLIALLALGFLCGGPAVAPAHAATRSTAFADAEPGPRVAAMGGAGVAGVADPTAAWWNPAGLYFMTGKQAQADYDAVQTLAGIIPAAWQQQDMTVISGNQSSAAAIPTVQGGFNWAAALGGSKDLMSLGANLLDGFGSKSTGSSGTGLTLPGGDVGLSAPTQGFWAPRSSTTLL